MSKNYHFSNNKESYPMQNRDKSQASFSRNKSMIPTPKNIDNKTVQQIRRINISNKNVIEKRSQLNSQKKKTKIHSHAKQSSRNTQVNQKTSEERMNEKINKMEVDIGVMKTNIGVMKTNIGVMKTDIGVMKTDIGEIKENINLMKTEVVGAIDNLGNILLIEMRNLGNVIKSFLGIPKSENEILISENIPNKIIIKANDPYKTKVKADNSNKVELKLDNPYQIKYKEKEDVKKNNRQFAQVTKLNQYSKKDETNSNSLGNSGESFKIEYAYSLDETKKINEINNSKKSDTHSSKNGKNGQSNDSQLISLSLENNSKESLYSEGYSQLYKEK